MLKRAYGAEATIRRHVKSYAVPSGLLKKIEVAIFYAIPFFGAEIKWYRQKRY